MSENKSHYPKIRSVGLNGILVTFSDTATDAANRAAIAFRTAIDKLKWPEIAESSSTLVSAFFQIDLLSTILLLSVENSKMCSDQKTG